MKYNDAGDFMCCRFYTENDWNLADVKTGEIFPADTVPVLANSRTMIPKPFAMKWGYSAGGKLRINARSETASQKEIFADGMRSRRCLIPMSCYYEWENRGSQKTKYAVYPVQGRAYLAGIYRKEAGNPVFTVLTRDPLPEIRFLHDRMPVILPQETAGEWLRLDLAADDVLKAAVPDIKCRALEPVQESLF